MTEPDVWQLVLKAQEAATTELILLGKAVVKLETKVDEMCRQRSFAVKDHDDCRREIHALLTENRREHDEFSGRLGEIEAKHDQEYGGISALGYLWRGGIALLGALLLVLNIIQLV